MLIKVKIAREVPGLYCPVLDTTPSSDPLAPFWIPRRTQYLHPPSTHVPKACLYENILNFTAPTNPTP